MAQRGRCHASHCLVTINAAIKVRLNTNTLPGTVHNSQSKQYVRVMDKNTPWDRIKTSVDNAQNTEK